MDYENEARIQRAASIGGRGAPLAPPSGDTFTGQMIFMDEVIKRAHEVLGTASMIADRFTPGSEEAAQPGGAIGKIAQGPESGPLLYLIQNRTQELHGLLNAIARQHQRVEQSL